MPNWPAIIDWMAKNPDVILAFGALVAGGWAAWTYGQSKKAEAARWQKQIFDDLFLSGHFDAIRDKLEFEYDEGLARIVELSMQNRDSELSATDRKLLLQLDNFLNLVEYILYLEQDRHQIRTSDRRALLDYWTGLIRNPSRSAIRFYASHYGYERISKLTADKQDPVKTYLVLYGSLRAGQKAFEELGLSDQLAACGTCSFDGDLYDLGDFPGATAGKGRIKAEIFEVTDLSVLDTLDDYEEFDVNDPQNSLFVRRCVHIEEFGDAWVYMYNGPKKHAERIASGDWVEHHRARAGAKS